MIRLPLSQGQFALIDDDDFEKVGQFKWCAAKFTGAKGFYAVRGVYENKIKIRNDHLHRVIMNAPKGMVADHVNHNTLDCQKQNLRICTHGENMKNRSGPTRIGFSGVRGVHFRKDNGMWTASMRVNGKDIYFGQFEDKEDAIRARESGKKYHGEFAGAL